jgi:hypothetical protein
MFSASGNALPYTLKKINPAIRIKGLQHVTRQAGSPGRTPGNTGTDIPKEATFTNRTRALLCVLLLVPGYLFVQARGLQELI